MGIEIERKFLVQDTAYQGEAKTCFEFRQGYLNSQKERVVRVRTRKDIQTGEVGAFLTIKGKGALQRQEWEYAIPAEEAHELLGICEQPIIEKRRYVCTGEDEKIWEVDEFFGVNEGLTVAEIELQSEDETFAKPSWLAEEVTGDPRYFNASLISKPYSTW